MNLFNGYICVVEDGGYFLEEEGFVIFIFLINRM